MFNILYLLVIMLYAIYLFRKVHLYTHSIICDGTYLLCVCGGLFLLVSSSTISINGVYAYDYDEFMSSYCKENYRVFSDTKINDACVTYEYDLTDVNASGLFDRIISRNYVVEPTIQIDTSELRKLIDKYNENAEPCEDAYLVAEENNYGVVQEVDGNRVDVDAVVKAVKSENYPIELSDYFEHPSVLASDLKDLCDELNRYVGWSVTYDNGSSLVAGVENVTFDNNAVVLNTEFLSSGIKEALKAYNTVGISREFVTHAGETITVSGGTLGMIPDVDAKIEFLENQFRSGVVEGNRTPIYTKCYGEIGNTYVEVSLDDQHLWVYENGVMTMDSDIVTGTKGKSDTPTGVYYMSECIPGKYLTGENYRVWVDKWMRLTNTGVGLHDASNRRAFGGNIYKMNGSHGCINLPVSFAEKLYKFSFVGCPVIVY